MWYVNKHARWWRTGKLRDKGEFMHQKKERRQHLHGFMIHMKDNNLVNESKTTKVEGILTGKEDQGSDEGWSQDGNGKE